MRIKLTKENKWTLKAEKKSKEGFARIGALVFSAIKSQLLT